MTSQCCCRRNQPTQRSDRPAGRSEMVGPASGGTTKRSSSSSSSSIVDRKTLGIAWHVIDRPKKLWMVIQSIVGIHSSTNQAIVDMHPPNQPITGTQPTNQPFAGTPSTNQPIAGTKSTNQPTRQSLALLQPTNHPTNGVHISEPHLSETDQWLVSNHL